MQIDQDADIVLMRRFQNGEESAFEELLEKHHRHVINFGYRFLGSREEAEDLAQEVFLRIYKSKDSYKPTAAFTTWLYKIAANLALHWKAKRRIRLAASLDVPISENHSESLAAEIPDPQEKRPEEKLEEQELQKVIQQALLTLPENQRITVLLAKYEDMSMEEIAQALDTSAGAVKQFLFRAKSSLKEKLTPYLSAQQPKI